MAVRSGRRTTMRDRGGEAGGVDRRLPGGVAAPHDDDVVAGELAGGRHRRAVVDPAADQLLERLDAQPAVVDPGRDEHRPGVHVAAVGVHDVVVPVRAPRDAGRRPAGEEAGAEPQRLPAGALRQAHAGDAAREAEVVADHRAGAGLAADGLGLEADGGQALARGVHAGGQPGRARADHDEVDDLVDVDVVGSAVELVGQRPHVGAVAAPPGQGGHDRPPALVLRAARHHLAAHLAVGVVHAGRHPDPGEVVEQVAGQRRPSRG